MKKQNIIIIGAGPAGITAGFELMKNTDKYNIIILEESFEIGGISRTVSYNGNRMDIGGHRFFSKDQRVMEWWKELLPVQGKPSFDDIVLKREKTLSIDGPDPEYKDEVMLIRNRISRIYYLKKFFDYPISMKWQTFKNMGFSRTMKGGFSYLKSTIVKREENSLEDFYINRFGKVLYSMFFEGYTEKLWGRHPSQILADWGAQRVKGLSIAAVIKDMFKKAFNIKSKEVETSLIEEFMYPKYGPGQLWETAAKKFEDMGGVIKRGCSVKELICENNIISKVKYIEDNQEKEISSDIVISSMPLKDLVIGINDINKSSEILNIAKGLPYRDFVTIGILVNKLNLKNETNIPTLGNIVPDCWIYVQETEVKLGRIQIFNNWSPYLVQDPEKTVWIGLEYFCDENDEFWNMSDQDAINFASKELESMGIIKSSDILDSHREKVKKAYPAYFDTYEQVDEVIEYANSINNLYCVGRNGQHRYNNMDHSMATSFETVDHILGKSKDKSIIWNVNTEKDYHEEKK